MTAQVIVLRALTVGNDGPIISPFAQPEVVDTFVYVYHNSYLSVAHQSLDLTFEALRSSVNPTEVSDADLKNARVVGHRELETNWERVCQEEFLDPMMSAVGGLPTAEIARMAEALVGLQVLRQLTQAKPETVGGPIDVALITRENGFRWLRHRTLRSVTTVI